MVCGADCGIAKSRLLVIRGNPNAVFASPRTYPFMAALGLCLQFKHNNDRPPYNHLDQDLLEERNVSD